MNNKYFAPRVNEYVFCLAERAAEIAGTPIKAEWIYCQWAHETGQFTSELMQSNHNLGGLCQVEKNDSSQPDGDQYYIHFPSYEACAEYFGYYLRNYREDGIYGAETLADYVRALKHGGYFGDTMENYLAGTNMVFEECFSAEHEVTEDD